MAVEAADRIALADVPPPAATQPDALAPARSVLPVLHPEILLAELRAIRRALDAVADVSVVPALGRGTRVRVVRGPLAGVEGLVVARLPRWGRHELVLNVSILGRAVVVRIDALDLEPLAGFAAAPTFEAKDVAAA